MSGELYMGRFLTHTASPRNMLLLSPWYRGSGEGALSGSSPNGLTTNTGVPTSADVTVRVRAPGSPFDGLVVRTTVSDAGGEWLIVGLNPNISYDVVGRLAGENDVVASDVTPYTGFPRFTEADDTRITDSGDARVSE